MTDTKPTRSLDDAIGDLRIAMITTQSPSGLEARPVTLIEQAGGTLHFLVSNTSDWVSAIESSPSAIGVTMGDTKGSQYVSLRGQGRVVKDKAEIERLWNPAASVFFDGPEDPNAVALLIEVEAGEWWDAPNGRIGQALAMVKAKITGDPEAVGEQGTVHPG